VTQDRATQAVTRTPSPASGHPNARRSTAASIATAST
jgi:hypothetical protein